MSRQSTAGRKFYAVVENTPGCLPESEPFCCEGIAAAGDYALSLARELRECGYTVRGNKREGYGAYDERRELVRVVDIMRISEALFLSQQ